MATPARHSLDSLSELRAGFHGTVVGPESPEYDEARSVWNGMIDRRPLAVARCADVEDVVRCVEFARRHEWPLAVRGGSHNVAGLATVDDGLVIDLSLMRRVTVDPVRRLARVEGGATWADVDGAGQVHGLSTPGGLISETGVAGLTLSGGLGWLRGKHGVTCDNVISAELVTADGRVVTASETENPELLWALRGGGGNFGVVTAFQFQLHPVGPEVMFSFVFHDGKRRREALRFFREFAATTPDELAPVAVLGTVPQGAAEFPPETYGRTFTAFAGAYIGPIEEGERIVRPLREFGEPLVDFSGPTSWLDVQRVFNADYPRGLRYYWKSALLNDLSDEAIEVIASAADAQVSELTTIDVWHLGGAMRREPPGGAAFGGRTATFMASPEANWVLPSEDAANMQWARKLVADLKPFSGGATYLNFPGLVEEGEGLMRAAFGDRYERLVEVKTRWDPENLFRLNQNIAPLKRTA
jgi:FAD/FMN-containing dehydrogenase